MAQSYIDAKLLASGLAKLAGADDDPIQDALNLQKLAWLKQQQESAALAQQSAQAQLEQQRAEKNRLAQLATVRARAEEAGMSLGQFVDKYGRGNLLAAYANYERERLGLGQLPAEQQRAIADTNRAFYTSRNVAPFEMQFLAAKQDMAQLAPEPTGQNGAFDRLSPVTPTMRQNHTAVYGQGLARGLALDEELKAQQRKRAKGNAEQAYSPLEGLAPPAVQQPSDATDGQIAQDIERANVPGFIPPEEMQVAQDIERANVAGMPEPTLEVGTPQVVDTAAQQDIHPQASRKLAAEIAKAPDRAVEVAQKVPPQVRQRAVERNIQAVMDNVGKVAFDEQMYDPKRFMTLPKGVPLDVSKTTTREDRLATYAGMVASLTSQYGPKEADRIMRERFGFTPVTAQAYVSAGKLPPATAEVMRGTANAIQLANENYAPDKLRNAETRTTNMVVNAIAAQAKIEAAKAQRLKTLVDVANSRQSAAIKAAKQRADLEVKQASAGKGVDDLRKRYYDIADHTNTLFAKLASFFPEKQSDEEDGVTWSLDDTGVTADGTAVEVDRTWPSKNVVISKNDLAGAVRSTLQKLYTARKKAFGGKETPNLWRNDLVPSKYEVLKRAETNIPVLKAAIDAGMSKAQAINLYTNLNLLPVDATVGMLVKSGVGQGELPVSEKRVRRLQRVLDAASMENPDFTAVAANLAIALPAENDTSGLGRRAISANDVDQVVDLAAHIYGKLREMGLPPSLTTTADFQQVLPNVFRRTRNLYSAIAAAQDPAVRERMRQAGIPAEVVQDPKKLADYYLRIIAKTKLSDEEAAANAE